MQLERVLIISSPSRTGQGWSEAHTRLTLNAGPIHQLQRTASHANDKTGKTGPVQIFRSACAYPDVTRGKCTVMPEQSDANSKSLFQHTQTTISSEKRGLRQHTSGVNKCLTHQLWENNPRAHQQRHEALFCFVVTPRRIYGETRFTGPVRYSLRARAYPET